VARADSLVGVLAAFGPCEIADRDASLMRWRAIRDGLPFAELPEHAIWRVSVPPSAGPALVAALQPALDFRHFYDWGGGMVWLAVAGAADGGAGAIRAALPSDNGHATLLRGGDAVRESVAVFQPLAPALAALSARVKSTFDPTRILNPGRMYHGV
jgi:glycolate oxidase FAD binding subunit